MSCAAALAPRSSTTRWRSSRHSADGMEVECSVLGNSRPGRLTAGRDRGRMPTGTTTRRSTSRAGWSSRSRARVPEPVPRAGARAGGRGLQARRLRRDGPRRLLRGVGRPRARQRAEHDPRLHAPRASTRSSSRPAGSRTWSCWTACWRWRWSATSASGATASSASSSAPADVRLAASAAARRSRPGSSGSAVPPVSSGILVVSSSSMRRRDLGPVLDVARTPCWRRRPRPRSPGVEVTRSRRRALIGEPALMYSPTPLLSTPSRPSR